MCDRFRATPDEVYQMDSDVIRLFRAELQARKRASPEEGPSG